MAARLVPVNYFDAAHSTIAVSPSASVAMPVSNLQSPRSDLIWQSTSDLDQVIDGNFNGGARQISFFGMWPAPPDSLIGARVRLQMWSDTAKSASVLDQTWDFFTPSGGVWGTFLWGIQNWGVDNDDRTARLAPLVQWLTPVAVSAYRITVSRTGALEKHYFASRRIWLGDYVQAPYNASYGAAPKWQTGSTQQRTIGGALRRTLRSQWRELRFETNFITETDRAKWFDLCYMADPGKEIVIALFQDGTKLARDTTVLGSLEVLNPLVWQEVNLHKLELAIVES